MNMQDMTDDGLLETTRRTIQSERETTAQVVQLFQEISRRKLFLKRGYPNLYEMATVHFGYCAGSAMRRINAMRLVNEIPAIQSKIESGDLKLSAASQLQSFFYSEAKENRAYSLEEKSDLINTCMNKSVRDIQRELVKISPEFEKKELVRQTSEDRVRLNFSISTDLEKKIRHLKDLLSHSDPDLSLEDLLGRLVELGLEKYDPRRKAERAAKRQVNKKAAQTTDAVQSSSSSSSFSLSLSPSSALTFSNETIARPPTSEVEEIDALTTRPDDVRASTHAQNLCPTEMLLEDSTQASPQFRSRYVKAKDRHEFARHDDGFGCSYVDEDTGRRCGAKRFSERDHQIPFSHGGSNSAENLRPMCSAHNKYIWEHRSSHG